MGIQIGKYCKVTHSSRKSSKAHHRWYGQLMSALPYFVVSWWEFFTLLQWRQCSISHWASIFLKTYSVSIRPRMRTIAISGRTSGCTTIVMPLPPCNTTWDHLLAEEDLFSASADKNRPSSWPSLSRSKWTQVLVGQQYIQNNKGFDANINPWVLGITESFLRQCINTTNLQ